MKKILILLALLLPGCYDYSYFGDVTPQTRYGEECFERPYINKYGDSYLCQANAIAKHNKQVDLHNKAIQSNE